MKALRERFESKFTKDAGGCWLWTAGKFPNGYGQISMRKRTSYAHRVSHEIYVGQITKGLFVCHTCDIPSCVNPSHLWLGTNAENRADSVAKGRQARGDNHGSRLHPERLARGDNNGARLYPERMPRGEQHSRAKLTTVDVLAIRAAVGMTQQHLGIKYGVSQKQISRIRLGKKWAHLPPGNSNEVEFRLAAQRAAGVPVYVAGV